MSFGDSVWKRAESMAQDVGNMDERTYIGAVSGFTAYGLILSAILAYFTMGWQIGWVGLLFFGLAIPIGGIFLALGSDNWLVSLIGHTMVAGGFGLVLGPCVAQYNAGVVMQAVVTTGAVTVVASFVGITYPKSLAHWGSYLFYGLLALLFFRIAEIFFVSMTGTTELTWWMQIIEYGAVVLFTLYIVYDWNRAMRLPRTLDNAVDCAMAIYLDIINLFLTILRLMRGSSSD